MMTAEGKFAGLLIGTAVADSLGLPREGLSAKKAHALFGHGALRQSLIVLPGKRIGLCSDDTEHAWLTAQALIETNYTGYTDELEFAKNLGKRLKLWFLALPAGGGMATLRACLRLCIGISPEKSGINSAGNGAAMRAPIIGAFFAYDQALMARMLVSSTSMTHRDERAREGAWVIAMAMRIVCTQNSSVVPADAFFESVLPYVHNLELKENILCAQHYLQEGKTLPDLLKAFGAEGKGVTGYINNTVPAVIFTWLRYYGDYEQAVTQIVEAGGDTDTTAALVGALVGAGLGVDCIPEHWVKNLKEWPANVRFLNQMAKALAQKQSNLAVPVRPPQLFWPFVLLRNLAFLLIVLAHGFRRLLPF